MCVITGFSRKLLAVLLCISMLLIPLSLPLTAADTTSEQAWLWPVPGSYRINSLDYYYSGGKHNQGQCVDISCNGYNGEERLDIVSATSGSVFYIRDVYNETTNKGSGWGNYVIVQSGDIMILYAHLQSISCSYGPIEAGDVIGKMGNTGTSTAVHLHMQAYPSDSDSYDNSIYAFDYFKDNPLYNTRFEFLDGLPANSKRYGSWIREHFKTKKGSYYTYSGGLSASYAALPLSAEVTVITTSGAAQYPTPVLSEGASLGTLDRGAVVSISGYYVDAYGDTWLRVANVSPDRWIRAVDVGFYQYTYATVLQNPALPEGTFAAFADLSFGGTLVSANTISSLKAEVLSGKTVVSSYSTSVNASTMDCSLLLASKFSQTSLPDGKYTFRLSVTESATYPGVKTGSKTSVIATSEFSIDSTLSDRIPPVIDSFAIHSLNATSVTFFLSATDNHAIGSVTAEISDQQELLTHAFVKGEQGYTLTLPASSLSGEGNYSVSVTVSDTYGNFAVVSRDFILFLDQVWTIKADATPYVRVRSTPKIASNNLTSYRLYPSDEVIITEFYDDGQYLWGKYKNGWFATSYATYQRPALTVNFDLNGSKDAAISPLSVLKEGNVTLPSTVPTREGCQFLGWATASDATTAEYKAGSTYSVKESVTLFAVWKTETYRINDGSSMSVFENYLIVDRPFVTSAAVLAAFDVNGSISVLNADSQVVSDPYELLTGECKIEITYQNTKKVTLSLVVLGDADGDGVVTQQDVTTIMKLSNGMIAPTENDRRLIAGDLDRDGVVTSTDAFLAALRT